MINKGNQQSKLPATFAGTSGNFSKNLSQKLLKNFAFVPFTVLGYPDLKSSEKIIDTYIQNAATMLELGIAFSDPTADGPVIQAADQIVINQGIKLDSIFKLLAKIKSKSKIPISIMVYANIVYHFGVEEFYRKLSNIGIEAILIVDLPLEEIALVSAISKKYRICQIFVIHEQISPQRLKKISQFAGGYFYVVSKAGITGVREGLPLGLKKLLQRLKKISKLPLLVGFGVSSKKQVREIKKNGADGVIIGSKLIDFISKNYQKKDFSTQLAHELTNLQF